MRVHGFNVASDHFCSRFYSLCVVCGHSYHAEDGECSCTASLDACACGSREWEVDERGRVVCGACGTEPGAVADEDGDEE